MPNVLFMGDILFIWLHTALSPDSNVGKSLIKSFTFSHNIHDIKKRPKRMTYKILHIQISRSIENSISIILSFNNEKRTTVYNPSIFISLKKIWYS